VWTLYKQLFPLGRSAVSKCMAGSCERAAVHVYPDSSAPGCMLRLCDECDEKLHLAKARFDATAQVFHDCTDTLYRIEKKIDDLFEELKKP
jgi:hypothetical protein